MQVQQVYSYDAVFEDGTVITQDCKDPEGDKCLSVEGGPNRFTDVLKKQEESKLIYFTAYNDSESWTVDLRDGHFEHNGVPFFQHRPDLDNYKDFRIIFYHTTRRHFHAGTLNPLGVEIFAYGLGWQTTHEGKNEQRFIYF